MPEWAWLIDAALACRLSRGSVGFDDERARAGTDELIALVAARIDKAPAPELASANATTPRAEPPGAA